MNKILFIGVFILIFIFIFIKKKKKSKIRNKEKKICICTWYDNNIKEYAEITSKINKKYCEINGYDYIIDHTKTFSDRHPSWERFPLFLKLMNTEKYDYIVWIDADACFRLDHPNLNLLNDIINNNNKDIIFSYDYPRDPKQINNGFIIIKNTEYSKKFCHEVINNKSKRCVEHYNKPNWEQECVRYFNNNNVNNLKNHSIILPFKLLQTFDINENKDSLIIHAAGINKNKRIKIFNYLLKKYNL
jgi:hypothetical protein